MVENPFLVWTGAGLLLLLVCFMSAKICQDRHRIGQSVLWTFLGCALCLFIWGVVVVPRPLHLWQRIVGAASAPCGLLLYYAAIKEMFGTRRRWSLVRSKAFWSIMLLIVIVILLDMCLGENAPVYDSTDPAYAPSLLSLVESALNYLTLLFLDTLIVQVYYQCWQRMSHLLDQCRLGLCLTAFLLNAGALVLVEAGVLLALCGHVQERLVFNAIYHVSLPVTTLLLVCSYILPASWLLALLRPVVAWRARRQEQQQALLRQLHQTMVTIVPGVHLPCEQIHDLRVLIEISDARQIIWSQQPRSKLLTPLDEARHLQALISTHTVLTTAGAYVPVATRLKETVRHNVLVARRLRIHTKGGS